jgi:hypothetical protein
MDRRLLLGIGDTRVRVWSIDRMDTSAIHAWTAYRDRRMGHEAKGKVV